MTNTPYDLSMATTAVAIQQAMTMGGVVIQKPKPGTGFTVKAA